VEVAGGGWRWLEEVVKKNEGPCGLRSDPVYFKRNPSRGGTGRGSISNLKSHTEHVPPPAQPDVGILHRRQKTTNRFFKLGTIGGRWQQ